MTNTITITKKTEQEQIVSDLKNGVLALQKIAIKQETVEKLTTRSSLADIKKHLRLHLYPNIDKKSIKALEEALIKDFTLREKAVWDLQHLKRKEIARALDVDLVTVNRHIQNIKRKLLATLVAPAETAGFLGNDLQKYRKEYKKSLSAPPQGWVDMRVTSETINSDYDHVMYFLERYTPLRVTTEGDSIYRVPTSVVTSIHSALVAKKLVESI